MVGVNLADFKPVATSTLNTGFYQEAAKKSARIILLRTPKNVPIASSDAFSNRFSRSKLQIWME